ncbi:hypothetical protein LZP69_15140 [Shewanella sp. AS1]|uniref:hypothetical protein n=1 Tax=Shewanella sp. AS1 TaxID=2907626 RepID=UPI001F21202A|nr:hypothetical protein [Shewanella sp. AS1]MCE9680489.1 hypothetical protein [Shewanella sp. AS1]
MKAKQQRLMYGAWLLCLSLVCTLTALSVEAKTPDRSGYEKARGDKHQRHHSHHRHHRHRDFWRWGLGLSLTYPLWSNTWGYWGNRDYFPYGYRQSPLILGPAQTLSPPQTYRPQTVTSPPLKLAQPSTPVSVTRQIKTSQTIQSLPANARVIQREGGTVYEWQGTVYVYDWQSQSYKVVKPASPKSD